MDSLDLDTVEGDFFTASPSPAHIEQLTIEEFKLQYPGAPIVPGMVVNGSIAVIKPNGK